jgi:hypothetical protein
MKFPPIGSIVKVVWLDSGVMSQGRTDTAPEDVKLFLINTYGKLVHIGKDLIVIISENNERDDHIIYTGIAISCIVEIGDFGIDGEIKKRKRAKRKTAAKITGLRAVPSVQMRG